MITRTKQ